MTVVGSVTVCLGTKFKLALHALKNKTHRSHRLRHGLVVGHGYRLRFHHGLSDSDRGRLITTVKCTNKSLINDAL
jgi:hypothetical protein